MSANETKPGEGTGNDGAGNDGANAGAGSAGAAGAGSAGAGASQTPTPPETKKAGKGAKVVPKAGVRMFYRDPESSTAELRAGKFFEVGEDLVGVDAKHLKDMEASDQIQKD